MKVFVIFSPLFAPPSNAPCPSSGCTEANTIEEIDSVCSHGCLAHLAKDFGAPAEKAPGYEAGRKLAAVSFEAKSYCLRRDKYKAFSRERKNGESIVRRERGMQESLERLAKNPAKVGSVNAFRERFAGPMGNDGGAPILQGWRSSILGRISARA